MGERGPKSGTIYKRREAPASIPVESMAQLVSAQRFVDRLQPLLESLETPRGYPLNQFPKSFLDRLQQTALSVEESVIRGIYGFEVVRDED